MADLPTLDCSGFIHQSPEDQSKFCKALAESFRAHGFVKLINTGIDVKTTSALLDWSNKFFSLPADVKGDISCIRGPHPQRGWSCVGSEQTSKLRKENAVNGNANDLTDAREHFDAGPPGDEQYPNKWPQDPSFANFQPFIEKTYAKCQEVSMKIMAAMEVGLGLKNGELTELCKDAASEIRMNHYPSIAIEKLSEGLVKRTWPHTDFGIVTLLFQDQVGGLELEDRSNPGTFVPVAPPARNGEIVVNISNTFERWTNNVIRAGVHQVTVPPAYKGATQGSVPPRHSCVFFFKASRNTSVGPLSHFVTQDNPAQYDDVTALQYQQRMTKELY
ncbi:putative gibberellin 20-oxidase [Nemania sp. NC0429]|nr:putative gibberellin 20-oxidase [Nemania sp. NC0429]